LYYKIFVFRIEIPKKYSMKSVLRIGSVMLVAVLHFTVCVFAQNKNPQSFFPKADLMKIGVYYYPEQWKQEQWERDLNNIKKFGFEFTHFAEFSWTFLEPKEGQFDFKWLDEAINLAEKAGLKVILCTPTPAPPAWMGEKYPEIYLVDETGRRREHGNRANQSVTNQKYDQFVTRIVTELGKRYGNNKTVWGWQIDNEPGAAADFSPSARLAFQKWLRAKYVTIDKLNEAWVGSFWSTRYDNFEQIIIPNATVYFEDKLSPHAVVDFKRFTAQAQADFLNRQAEILRKSIDRSQWITTNYTNVTYDADPRLSNKMDFTTFTMYPVSGRNILGGNSFRVGNPYRLAEANDFFRPISGVTGLMELQPGQVNWAPINPQLEPGAVHMWLMHTFGGGNSFVCTYRYRHPLGSSEMYHDGIVETDGVTLSRGGKEFVQAIEEMKILRKAFDSNSKLPEKLAQRKTAFLWNHENLWDLENQKQTEAWNTWRHRNYYSMAVKSTGSPLDFISEKDDFSKYSVVVAPAYQLIDKDLADRWTKYAENGGNLILSVRTGQKDRNGHFWEDSWSAPITSLIGAKIEFFDMLAADVKGKIKTGDKTYNWNSWSDILTAKEGTEVLATYGDQFYAGKAAAITRKIGKGSVTYIGAESEDGSLERDLVRKVYERAGIEIENLPKGVYIDWRDGFFVGVNYSNENVKLPIPNDAKILVGENPLKSAQAVVWKQ